MKPELWSRVEAEFERLADLPLAEQHKELQAMADEAVRKQVAGMLASDQALTVSLEDAVAEASAGVVEDLATGDQGLRAGPYQLTELIGQGGMGSVYRAVRADDQFRKNVAVKVLQPGTGRDDLIERFERERQILADLEHPNVARLIDGGATSDGRPYVVMEFVEGVPLDEYVAQNKPALRDRVRLFQAICAAVNYAHQNLIIHRDIKPANILVSADGTPKLLDFGIAKLLRDDVDADVTRTALRMMTPQYASPEHVRGEAMTTAADVYSLGVLLYQLLTDEVPYRPTTSSAIELERLICDAEPKPPSQNASGVVLARELRGDLDNIVLRCLRKEPARRYTSTAALSEDLQRYLDGFPVEARPDSWGYRTSKFVRRNRYALAGAAAALFVVVALVAFYTRQLQAERDRARVQAATAERVSDFLVTMFEEANPDETPGDQVTARQLLDSGAERIRDELAGEEAVQARLLQTMGRAYYALGLFEQAKPIYEDALSMRRTVYGETSQEAAQALSDLASNFSSLGEFETAERLHQESLAVNREVNGPEHLEVATALHNLGHTRFERGEYAEAVRLLREGVEMRKRLKSEPHYSLAQGLGTLGQALEFLGDHEEAEDYLRQALAMNREVLPPEHPSISQTMHNLAIPLQAQGEFAESEALLREALDLSIRYQGGDHPDISAGYVALAMQFIQRDRFADAEEVFRQALDHDRRTQPADHWSVGYDLLGLARAIHSGGDAARAEPHYRAALANYTNAFQAGHPRLGKAKSTYAEALLDLGRPREAYPLAKQGWEAISESLPETHGLHRTASSVYGAVVLGRGDVDQARELLESSVAGEPDVTSRWTQTRRLERMVALYEATGDSAKKAEFSGLLAALR